MKPTPIILVCPRCGNNDINGEIISKYCGSCEYPEEGLATEMIEYIPKSSVDALLEAAKVALEHLQICIEKEHWVAIGKEEVSPLHQLAIDKLEKAIADAEGK